MEVRGRYNSSITRVRPLFGALLERDPRGNWLSDLLALAPNAAALSSDVANHPGSLLPTVAESRRYREKLLDTTLDLPRCFEAAIPPAPSFLRWLLDHPDELNWSVDLGSGRETVLRREELRGDHGPERKAEVQASARAELAARGAERSRRKWWAFEGFTSVDCLLETDRLVLFVEGKRNESLQKSTRWFPRRNQLIRNLEVAQHLARGRRAGVLLATEHEADFDFEAILAEGTPHLDEAERTSLRDVYLGQVRWEELRIGLGVDVLPDTLDEVRARLPRYF